MFRLIAAIALTLTALTARAEVNIQTLTTPGGINAWLVEEPSIPFVALEIRIRGGANLDLPGKRGAGNLMVALLEEGSGEMDAQAFATAREDLAARFGFSLYDDSFGLSAQFLTENRDDAVSLLRQALVNPRFDQDAIDRVRGQILSIIASDAQDPNALAGDAFYAAAYPDHPYGTSLNGTPESLNALTRDDLVTAHARLLTRDRLYVGAVGDITPAALSDLIDDLFGDLPATGPELPPVVPFGLPGGVTVIDFPTPQSVALFGQIGMERDDPDYFAMHILNHILGGGGFESRLMQEVREKRGLTYGIGTYLVPRDYTALWLGQVASDNTTVAQAIDVVRAEWARLATDGVSQEELDTARTYITGEYPLRFDGNANIAEILVGMQMVGLPPDYVVRRNEYMNAVTLEDINRVAREWLDPEGLVFFVAGRPEGL